MLMAMLFAVACGDDSPASKDASSGPDASLGDAATDGSIAGGTLTAFVIDLVTHQTASNTPPVAFATFTALPDPDSMANNTAAYTSLFP